MSIPPPFIDSLPIWFLGSVLALLGAFLMIHDDAWSWPMCRDIGLTVLGGAAIAFDLRSRASKERQATHSS
jgi:hypothetical protein